MPFYEYQCSDCNHRLEVLQKISDEPLIFCPQCNQASLKKLISASVFRLKGSGWYATDFKDNDRKKEKSAGEKSSETKSPGEKSTETKSAEKSTETKPADKQADTKQSNDSGNDKSVATSASQSKENVSSAAT